MSINNWMSCRTMTTIYNLQQMLLKALVRQDRLRKPGSASLSPSIYRNRNAITLHDLCKGSDSDRPDSLSSDQNLMSRLHELWLAANDGD